MHVLGLDIGGANLKAADGEGQVRVQPFPVWQRPDALADALQALASEFPQVECFAVTMTAELADCFVTKAEGVSRILAAVEEVANQRPVAVWQTGAEFVRPEVAREIPKLVAAANWHALATWVGRLLPTPSTALLLDVGSTTTDIIPLSDGVPVPRGLTDIERQLAGELVYSGVLRTPLCAVALQVLFRGQLCPIAAELFATTRDIYLLRGELPEDAQDLGTANGRPATRVEAASRLARMLCCDRTEIDDAELMSLADFFADAQCRKLGPAVDRVLTDLSTSPTHVLLSGSGTFLAESVVANHSRLQTAERIRLADLFPPPVAAAACAFAVARLAQERF